MKEVDLNYYPGFVRRAISFTIDDGSLLLDKKFIDIVAPAGITGTFNLIPSAITDENRAAYIEQYSPYDIANHVMYHPMGIKAGFTPRISPEPFDPDTADPDFLYESDREGFYLHTKNGGKRWFYTVTDDRYIELVNEGKRILEDTFGREIRDFVWPYGRQSDALFDAVRALGYRSMRGSVHSGFDLPPDRSNWGFYADFTNIPELSREFASLSDDGRLKAFIFGVHSSDFERAGRWDVLEDFCRDLGNRPEDFYYGTVSDIFETEDAIRAAVITEDAVINDSSRPLYITLDGERTVIAPHSSHSIR